MDHYLDQGFDQELNKDLDQDFDQDLNKFLGKNIFKVIEENFLELIVLFALESVWFLSRLDILVPLLSVKIKAHTLKGHFKSQNDVFNKKHTL